MILTADVGDRLTVYTASRVGLFEPTRGFNQVLLKYLGREGEYRMGNARELIELVLTHAEILNTLLADPKTKPALVEECEVSRTTVDRWINQLETASLVHRPGDRYELTLFGQVVTLKFDRVRTQLANLIRLREPLRTLSDAVDIEPEILESATVSFYDGLAPELAETLLTHDGRTRLIAPRIPCVFSVVMFRNPNPNVEIEVVVENEMATQLDAYFSNQHLPVLSIADIEIYQTSDLPPFCLALVERDGRSKVYLIFEKPQTGVAVVTSDAEDAVAWGEALYAECREGATECDFQYLKQPYPTLPDRKQCIILLEIMAGNATDETDVLTRNANSEDAADSPNYAPLRELEEAGYIEWDRDTGEIADGPNFADIRPLLELIAGNPEKLPRGW